MLEDFWLATSPRSCGVPVASIQIAPQEDENSDSDQQQRPILGPLGAARPRNNARTPIAITITPIQ